MGKSIEDVVSLEFDLKAFGSGIKGALSMVNDFKKQLVFTNETKSLDELNKAASNAEGFVNMSKSVETLTVKLRSLSVVGMTMISNLTTAAMNASKQLIDSAFIRPMRDGMTEFELQMNSIQTILANTKSKGTVLDDVTSALDELNRYADLTIYNFGNMTDNIGKFTAAGVDLDTSVSAIKGISNLAALSGASAEDAARAMYQLSQAISTGTVKLMDWNSVQNANLGGEIFQESLKETARNIGVDVDAIIAETGSFRDSLSTGWLSSEILLQTLQKLTGDLTDEQLKALGYTEEQIKEIQDLADTAVDAATKVKSLSQIVDVFWEAMGTGWADSWKIIFGDFYEARDLFTNISNGLGNIVSAVATARNEILQTWADDGGREKLINSLYLLVQLFGKLGAVAKAVVQQVFPPKSTVEKGHALYTLTERFENLVKSFYNFVARNGGHIAKFILGLASLVKVVVNVFKQLGESILSSIGIQEGYFDNIFSFIGFIGDLLLYLAMLVDSFVDVELWTKKAAEVMAYLSDEARNLFKRFTESKAVQLFANALKTIATIGLFAIVGLFMALGKAAAFVSETFTNAKESVVDIYNAFKDTAVIQSLLDVFRGFSLEDFIQGTKEAGVQLATIGGFASGAKESIEGFFSKFSTENIVQGIKDLDSSFTNSKFYDFVFNSRPVGSTFDRISSSIEWLTGVIDKLKASVTTASPTLVKFYNKVAEIASGVWDKLYTGLQNLDPNTVINTLKLILEAGLIGAISGIGFGGLARLIWEGLFGEGYIIGSLNTILEPFEELAGVLEAYQTNIKASALIKIAIAIGILTASILSLSLIDAKSLAASVAAISVLLGELLGSSGLLGKINAANSLKSMAVVVALSASMFILVSALRKLGETDVESLGRGLLAIGSLFAELTIVLNTMANKGSSSAKDVFVVSVSIGVLAVSLRVLAGAVKVFGAIDEETMVKGLLGIGGAIAEFIVFTDLIKPKSTLKASASLGVLAASLIVVSLAIRSIGSIDYESLSKGLVGMGVSLGEFALAMRYLPTNLLAKAFSLGVVAGGLVLFAEAVKVFGGLDELVLAKGFVAIAGGLTAMAVSLKFIGQTKTGALVLVGTALSLVVFAEAVKSFGNLDMEVLAKGLLATAGAMAILVIGLSAFKAIGIKDAVAFSIVAASLMLLVNAVKSLSELELEPLLIGLGGLAGIMIIVAAAGGAFALLGSAAPAIIAFAGAIFLVGAAFGLVGIGIGVAAGGIALLVMAFTSLKDSVDGTGESIQEIAPAMGEGLATALAAGITALLNHIPDMIEAGGRIMLAMIEGFITTYPALVEAIVLLLTSTLVALDENMYEFTNRGMSIIVSIIEGIGNNIQALSAAGGHLIAELLLGMSEHLEEVIDASFVFILTFLDGMTAAVDKYMPEIIAGTGKLALAIVNGFSKGILELLPVVVDSAWEMGDVILNTLKDVLDSHSPSKETEKIGWGAVEGFLKPFTDGIAPLKDKVTGFVDELLGSFKDKVPEFFNAGEGLKDGLLGGLTTDFGADVQKSLADLLNMEDYQFTPVVEDTTKALDDIKAALPGKKDEVEDKKIKKNSKKAASSRVTGVSSRQFSQLLRQLHNMQRQLCVCMRKALDRKAEITPTSQPDTQETVDTAIDDLSPVKSQATKVAKVMKSTFKPIDNYLKEILDKSTGRVQNGIKDLANGARNTMDEAAGRVVITPVVDDRALNLASARVNKRFSNVSPIVDKTSKSVKSGSTGIVDPTEEGKTVIKYYQYNTSPKALDPGTIYRQTKSQLNRFKLKTGAVI